MEKEIKMKFDKTNDIPKISIVTVCYNAGNKIEETILSVIDQTYNNLEYIIIDGASTDDSIEIIKKYAKGGSEFGKHKYCISNWISESDKGIYDAMNKGANLSNGEYIIYMNAGDTFVSLNILNDLSEMISNNSDVIYGDNLMVYNNAIIYHKAHFFSKYDINLPFNHQSALTKTNLLKLIPFDLNYKIAGDYNFFYKLYILGKRFQYIPMPIAYYSMDGISQQNIINTFREVSKIRGRKHNCNYYIQLTLLKLKSLLSRLLPQKLVNYYRSI